MLNLSLKITLSSVIFIISYCPCITLADNSSYITLSNQIARKNQLNIVTNNIANTKTIGYESDNVLLKNIDRKQSPKRANSFVYIEGSYKNENIGSLKRTNRSLDLAIGGTGYFKILTPRGYRYTLNGAIFLNSDRMLVNSDNMPFASRDNQPILLPLDTNDIKVSEDGIVYADNEEIDVLGVFTFATNNHLVKESNSLYNTQEADILMDEFTIISGALRESNVSSTKSLAEMLELQRSSAMTNNLMSDLADLEKSVITKIAK
jgi:flagellar basal-body rod protein FlgF